jgi:hypothetical protein
VDSFSLVSLFFGERRLAKASRFFCGITWAVCIRDSSENPFLHFAKKIEADSPQMPKKI